MARRRRGDSDLMKVSFHALGVSEATINTREGADVKKEKEIQKVLRKLCSLTTIVQLITKMYAVPA